MDIQFVTSVAVVTPDPSRSQQLYLETFGLPLADDTGSGYFHSEDVEGTRHFGIWPLTQAAQACFGEDEWPERRVTKHTIASPLISSGRATTAASPTDGWPTSTLSISMELRRWPATLITSSTRPRTQK